MLERYINRYLTNTLAIRKNQQKLVSQIRGYMETHHIPIETPLELLKYFSMEEVDPNQMRLDLDSGEVR